VYSQLFCGALHTSTPDLSRKKEDDFLIKIYKIELSKHQELASSTLTVLSDSERNRANRYHFLKDRNRFIICRTLLKFLLAEHLGLDIDKILVDVDSNKKPYVSSHPSVFFNVSHSRDYAVIAIATCPVGVDVEYVNTDFDYEEILPTTCNHLEIDEIRNSDDKYRTFYKFWTRKEAILKAIGTGIDDNLLKIPITDGFHSIPLSLMGNYETVKVFSFNLNDDYMSALAYTEDIHFDSIVFSTLPTSDEMKALMP
jgi:4'-phosphopantetheinyl transferase